MAANVEVSMYVWLCVCVYVLHGIVCVYVSKLGTICFGYQPLSYSVCSTNKA